MIKTNFFNCNDDINYYNADNCCNNNCQWDFCCNECNNCPCCINCPIKTQGPTGATGATGTSGVLNFADFYALMPPDNAATVGAGVAVDFPRNGPAGGTGITRISDSSFNLAEIGTYQILFQVSVSESGQLLLTLNGDDLYYTVSGRATGASQIVGMAIVTTTAINSILTVQNPSGNTTALTITPIAGGNRAVSAHLVITQIQ